MKAEGERGEKRGFSRHDLLKRAGLAGIAVAVPGAGAVVSRLDEDTADAAAPEREAREAFTSAESDMIEAIVARLIPSDANGPGAAEARVSRYIDRALAGALAHLAPFYSNGLAAVDAYAKSAYGAAFTSLPPDKQDAALADMEADKATGFTPSSSPFFETIREHALQGMFGDPYYGGNANFAGWDLIGFPGIRLHVPASQQRVGVAIPRAHKSTYDYSLFKGSKRGGASHEH
jgi:gluconate 2-dehydrogenase gamma chain